MCICLCVCVCVCGPIMTRAALIKLLILMIMTFIICLPEFFTLYKVLQVKLVCLPYEPCEQDNRVRGGESSRKTGVADDTRQSMCDPSQTSRGEKWEQACVERRGHGNTTRRDSKRGVKDREMSLFVCETHKNLANLQGNISSSGVKVHVEVWVELQLGDAQVSNLTLYGRGNHSSVHLHPPEEDSQDEDVGLYCCHSATSGTTNHNVCLLWLSNQTDLKGAARETLPRKRPQTDEWGNMFKVLWLTLLCLVVLTMLTTLLGKKIWKGRHCGNPEGRPPGSVLTLQQFKDREKYTEVVAPKGLTTIQEVDITDETETLLDGNVDHG